jgi:hypothetical protein
MADGAGIPFGVIECSGIIHEFALHSGEFCDL